MSPKEPTSRILRSKRFSIPSQPLPGAAPLLPWQPGQSLANPQKDQQAEDEASERHRGDLKAESRNRRPVGTAQILNSPEV